MAHEIDDGVVNRRTRFRALVLAALVVSGVGLSAPAVAGAVADPEPWRARRPLNIAHAGGDLEAPHETMYAYKRAVAVGVDVLELDIRRSADGVLMVVHDERVDRTTNTTGDVRERTAAELQALDNAYWFVPDCWRCQDRPASEYQFRGVRTGSRPAPPGFGPDDFAIPTLDQVLTTFPDRLLDIEIKDGPDGMLVAEELAALLNGSPRAERVVVVSFDDVILDHFRALAPEVATSPGVDVTTEWFLGGRGPLPGRVALQVPPVFSGIPIVSQEFVDDAHAAGLAVWVWFNGNDDDVPAEWNRLLDLGVDGLITGRPALLESVLDARAQHFVSGLDIGPIRVRHGRARIEVGCPAIAADRCRALLAVRADGAIVTGTLVDLAPGETGRLRLSPRVAGWRRLARVGLTVEWWGSPDTGPGTGPITAIFRR